ncbi:restriction endonuclease [Pseudoalteromonas sp. JBTF-M23]|uniref:Restriction endonuclease n=1 Tax=Pseudoalteromonas caenipelagi TaxID=2726988 RepID=A0A849VAB5_9GAMM|nr:restriction endonuclease [Pseudoalteromonas caenipelagi]NOU49808.1 restriction endonuclease [Pseudoalteromonas caenipelagi]
MSPLVHYEYAPPRSWEQFEELCADLFECMWDNHELIRHGRSGQSQCGVDIVAARGSIYPIGLQCKKKSRWPIKKLSKKDIDTELKAASKFTPKLKEFYLLTTAEADATLEEHVRLINGNATYSFKIHIIFWPELVRKVALHKQVAQKHFPIHGGNDLYAPLLTTWYTNQQRLELQDEQWRLAALEAMEDLHARPTGRIIIRQRESDQIQAQLQALLHTKKLSSSERWQKLALRKQLRSLESQEQHIQKIIRLVFSNSTLRFYMMDYDSTGEWAPLLLRRLIESSLNLNLIGLDDQKIRIAPPTPELLPEVLTSFSVAKMDIPLNIPYALYEQLLQKEYTFKKEYNKNMAQDTCELPNEIRFGYAFPFIIQRVIRIMEEEHLSMQELEKAGYLDLTRWTYTH